MAVVSDMVRRGARALVPLVVLGLGCAEPRTTEPDAVDPTLAKAPSGPTVTTAVPDNSPRDTTMDVRVRGSGFDAGSLVELTLAGIPDPLNVHTNSTRFVGSTELVANITISTTAVPGLYDVVVKTSQGKKGIGTGRFLIRAVNDLGPADAISGQARGVNAGGTIVGAYTDRAGIVHGFAWTASDGMRVLPSLGPPSAAVFARGVSDGGVIVGEIGNRATRWVPNGAGSWLVEDLGTLGGTNSYAYEANETGTVAGYSHMSSGSYRGFLWTKAGGMIALPMMAGVKSSRALAINEAGTVVGEHIPVDQPRPVAWPANGNPVELATCSGSTSASAQDINDADVIVGVCLYSAKGKTTGQAVRWVPDPTHARRWLAPQALTPQTACPACGRAWAINNAGEIVGLSGGRPFLWSETQGDQVLATLSWNGDGEAFGISDAQPGSLPRMAGRSTQSGAGGKQRAVWWP